MRGCCPSQWGFTRINTVMASMPTSCTWYWLHFYGLLVLETLPFSPSSHCLPTSRSLSAEPLRSQDALSHMLMFTLHSSWKLQSQGRMLSALPLPLGLLSICGKAEKDLLLLCGDSYFTRHQAFMCWRVAGISSKGGACRRNTVSPSG